MPLTAAGCAARRRQLCQAVDVDLFIISNPRHIHYLSGLYVAPLALSAWGHNFLLIDGQTGHSKLLVHNFIAPDAQAAPVDEVTVWTWYDAATRSGIPIFREAVGQLNRQLGSHSTKRVGIEAGLLPREVEISEAVDVTDTLLAMRRRKDPDELDLIREAIRAVEAGHAAARQIIKPGLSELQVYNAMYAAIVEAAGHAVLPLGDFASGERAYAVGGPATPRILQPGDLMILDVFPIVNGYRADFTATLSVDGHLSDLQQRLETALHAAIAAGETRLTAGTKTQDIYQAVKQALTDHGFGEGFTAHAGHGLGLGHPEWPFIVPESEETLLAGDVVTLEPGSYGPDFGARIEHNYLILADGFERLTHHQTEFAQVG